MVLIFIIGCNDREQQRKQPQQAKIIKVKVVWPSFASDSLSDGSANSSEGERFRRYKHAELVDFPYINSANVDDTIQLRCIMHENGAKVSWEIISIRGPFSEKIISDSELQVEEMKGVITRIDQDSLHSEIKK